MHAQKLFAGFEGVGDRDIIAILSHFNPGRVKGISAAEQSLLDDVNGSDADCRLVEKQVRSGHDPLGDLFCKLRSPELRRTVGATYTPPKIVASMLQWAQDQADPARVIDPGTGSARFLLAAGRAFPQAQLVGFEIDPLAALIARANLAIAGFADRSEVILGDYRSASVSPIDGRTLYIGNPPYVRHHLIEPAWKRWLTREAKKFGARASQLAGLHAYFFLATARVATTGDIGAFITAAEWLDVNYGSLIRDLFVGRLGGSKLIVIEPTVSIFADAATTSAITCFQVGSTPRSVRVKRIANADELNDKNGNRILRRERFETESRWSHLTRSTNKIPSGFIELGEVFRVHRGQVTGANRIWIAGTHSEGLPASVLFPTVTKAIELFRAGRVLADANTLRRVIDIPFDLAEFDRCDRRRINRFLKYAQEAGAHQGYVALNRKAWWSVGLRQPAPILATYMARRPPAFVRNRAAARHINIAHGLYPREPLREDIIARFVDFLSSNTELSNGRTYAGGLTKFEPREMERLLVPTIEELSRGQR